MNSTPTYRVWLLSPYHSGSHRVWANGYQRHSRHQIHLLTMAGRFWKWRMQGGAIEMATQATQLLRHNPPPDAIITTDMVNLPAWLGLMRHALPSSTPILHYMHENQLTYPLRPGEKPDLTYAMINWLSQLAADHVAFNSHYHATAWFAEVPRLLKHFPDYNHLAQLRDVQAKSSVLPVGIACGLIHAREIPAPVLPEPFVEQVGESESLRKGDPSEPPLILWNQRWEYDKNPKAFFHCLYALQKRAIPFRLVVAGENFRQVPREFEEARLRLANELIHWGYVKSYADYVAYLQRADLVISTAIHEFFGISILEAIAAGAFPLLPNRLSYPELIPPELHPACLYADEEELVTLSMQRLQMPRPAPPSLRQHVLATYDWPIVAAQYDESIEQLVAHKC
ncbi:MAG: DUF3524 domain-containing protein [Caldilineaceae bacterium]|nr:DUF3524 domain-containing protein [Caldilineaceae bacterium]